MSTFTTDIRSKTRGTIRVDTDPHGANVGFGSPIGSCTGSVVAKGSVPLWEMSRVLALMSEVSVVVYMGEGIASRVSDVCCV